MTYGPNGAYSYIDKRGWKFAGRWSACSDGAICVAFAKGRNREDRYVSLDGKLWLESTRRTFRIVNCTTIAGRIC